jgi:putative endonuclease
VTAPRGRAGEAFAAAWLERQGWTVLARNARTAAGELDLVCREGETLVFVEVKWRERHVADSPLAAVDARKRARLARAAACWCAQHGQDGAIRLDVVGLTGPLDGGCRVEHIRNAFGAGD